MCQSFVEWFTSSSVLPNGNLGPDGRAAARSGFQMELTADHLHTLAHAEDAQAIVSFRDQNAIDFKSPSVVGHFHHDGAGEFLDNNPDGAGMGMPGYVGERFLRQAIEGGAL